MGLVFIQPLRFSGQLSLRQLFEFAYINQIYGEQIHWNAIVQRFREIGYRRALNGYTAFAHAYLSFLPPPGVAIHGWNRWRSFLHRARVIAVSRPLRMRIRHLHMDPLNKFKKLLTLDL